VTTWASRGGRSIFLRGDGKHFHTWTYDQAFAGGLWREIALIDPAIVIAGSIPLSPCACTWRWVLIYVVYVRCSTHMVLVYHLGLTSPAACISLVGVGTVLDLGFEFRRVLVLSWMLVRAGVCLDRFTLRGKSVFSAFPSGGSEAPLVYCSLLGRRVSGRIHSRVGR